MTNKKEYLHYLPNGILNNEIDLSGMIDILHKSAITLKERGTKYNIDYDIEQATFYATIVAYLVKLKRYEDAYKELNNLELSPQNEDTSGILTCLGIIDKHLKEVPF